MQQFRMAHEQRKKEQSYIILVLMETLDVGALDHGLRMYIRTGTCINAVKLSKDK